MTKATSSLNTKALQDGPNRLVVQIATHSDQSKQNLEKIYDTEAVNYPTDEDFIDEQVDEIYTVESSSTDEDPKHVKILASERYNEINNLIQQIYSINDLALKAQKCSEASIQLWQFIQDYWQVIPLWFIEDTKDIADILKGNQFIYQASNYFYMSETAEDNSAKDRYYVLGINLLADFVDNYWEIAVPETRSSLANSARMLEQNRIESGENLIYEAREAEDRFISILRAVEQDESTLIFQPRSLSIISARQHLWTVDDYHRLGETGILTTNIRVELLEGKIIQMSPQTPLHVVTKTRTYDYLKNLLATRATIRIESPISLPPSSEPEPDIAVVAIDPREYCDRHPIPSEIFLLIEVTNHTRSNDLIIKRRMYAEAQIREYWVLDVKNRRVIVFRNPSGGNYQEKIVLNEDETFSLLAFPDVCVSLNQLFPLFS